jgi:hypothetical protein
MTKKDSKPTRREPEGSPPAPSYIDNTESDIFQTQEDVDELEKMIEERRKRLAKERLF